MLNIITIFWTVSFGIVRFAEAGVLGDQCDWTGSGLSGDGERAVTPVLLRCREGAVSWRYPRGALRLQFRAPPPAGDRDFQVCVRVLNTTEEFPARLFVEAGGRLRPLYWSGDGDPRRLRCFSGRRALYVEAAAAGPRRTVAALQYETRAARDRCRPCSAAEMERAFCSSDLVSRALIVDSQHREDLDSTELTVQLTKLYRGPGPDADRAGPGLQRVLVPARCGAGPGPGELLVMARRRLGGLALQCAPRAAHWESLVRARQGGGAPCLLQY